MLFPDIYLISWSSCKTYQKSSLHSMSTLTEKLSGRDWANYTFLFSIFMLWIKWKNTDFDSKFDREFVFGQTCYAYEISFQNSFQCWLFYNYLIFTKRFRIEINLNSNQVPICPTDAWKLFYSYSDLICKFSAFECF